MTNGGLVENLSESEQSVLKQKQFGFQAGCLLTLHTHRQSTSYNFVVCFSRISDSARLGCGVKSLCCNCCKVQTYVDIHKEYLRRYSVEVFAEFGRAIHGLIDSIFHLPKIYRLLARHLIETGGNLGNILGFLGLYLPLLPTQDCNSESGIRPRDGREHS